MKKTMILKTLLRSLLACAVLSLALPAHAQIRPNLKNSNAALNQSESDPRYRWKDGINTAELSQLIKEQHQSVRRCYESQLKRTPKLEGSLDVRFKITHWGRVGKTKITNHGLSNRKVKKCVVKAIRKWRFPFTRKGGVTIELPLLFKPHSSDAPNPSLHTARQSRQANLPGA